MAHTQRIAGTLLTLATLLAAPLVTPAPTFSIRTGHVAAVKEGGDLVTWGNNSYGGYGDGRILEHPTPHQVGVPAMTQVWSGTGSVLTLDAQGRVWSWGDNTTFHLGERASGNNAVASMITAIADVVHITGGFRYAAALKRDGTVWFWGVLPGLQPVSPTPRQVASSVRAIAGGGDHILLLGNDGLVRAVGQNAQGQLGITTASSSTTPVLVPGLGPMQRVWAAGSLSFAQGADGKLWIWGGRSNVAAAQVPPPSQLTLDGRATSINGFPNLIAAEVFIATDTGKVYELPRPPQGNPAFVPPVVRPQFAGASAVIPGQNVGRVSSNDFLVVLYPDGSIRTQGGNLQGQLGDGSLVDNQAPALVRPLIDQVVAAATLVRSVVALRRDGTVWTWGSNGRSQQADGVNPAPTVPYRTPMQNVVSVAAGSLFTIARTTSGKTYAWGANLQGQFCDGTYVSRSVPAVAPAFDAAVEIVAAANASAFLKGDGTVWICGYSGQLVDPPATPQRVDGLPAIQRIWSGNASFFARDTTGALWAWGDNSVGQLGLGTSGNVVTVPQQVPGLPATVVEIAASNHTLALLSNGEVWSWGSNNAGQTGRNPSTPVTSPQLVSGITQVAEMAAGGQHSLARRTDGSIWGWGLNAVGQLGLGDLQSRYVPTAMTDLGQFDAIGAGSLASFARRTDGTAFAWGQNSQNVNTETLGDGTYVRRLLPSIVLREGGAGRLDTNDWFLDLKPSVTTKGIPPAKVPRALAIASDGSSEGTVSLDARLTYRQSDIGRSVGVYALGYVPAAFLNQVRTAPGTPKMVPSPTKTDDGFVLVQLTPDGWGIVSGPLSAFVQGTANAAGSAHSILNGVGSGNIPGARFCVGYAEGGNAVLDNVAFRDVLEVPGSTGSSAQAGACVFTGAYLTGPAYSTPGATVSFTASVVGNAPTGGVTLMDSGTPRGSQGLSGPSGAIRSTVFNIGTLASGPHSLLANYPGDANNAASISPELVHTVAARAVPSVSLSGPASSQVGSSVTLATSLPPAATGYVRFADAGTELGSVAVVSGAATLVTSTLAVGGHSITASYEGDIAFAPGSSAPLAHTVVAPPAPLVLEAASNPARPNAGAAITLTATASGGASPAGAVRFFVDGAEAGTAPLQGGTASLAIGSLQAGGHTVVAHLDANGSNPAVSTLPLGLQVLPPQGTPVTLAVSVSGQGSINSTPAGIACSDACVATYDVGTSLSLAATPAQGWVFAGWNAPGCTLASACVPDLAASTAVTASFVAVGDALAPSAASVDFGGQSMRTTSPGRAITFENRSADTMAIEAVALTGPVALTHQCGRLAAGSTCAGTLAFTPLAEGPAAGSVVVVYTYGTTRRALAIPVTGTGEKSLVTHYYNSILRRAPDAGGRAFWQAEAARVTNLGANVNEVWFAMAQAFYFSAEYLALNRDNAGYATDLYNTFFNRAPDAGGLAFWVSNLAQGMPREVALAEFMFSAEFRSFTQAIFGAPTVRAEVNAVTDFYRGLLARLPDDGGFGYWLGRFRAAQCQGQAAIVAEVEAISGAFALSGEYAGRGRTNAQYVGDLYNAFLRRGGDLAGVLFWIGSLTRSIPPPLTREQLRQEFRNSPEFQGRVSAIIQQGCQQ